jgi:hypothetical protein
MANPEVTGERRFTASLDSHRRLTAICCLQSVSGRAPFFSVTGQICNPAAAARRPGGGITAVGMLHDEIEAAFPQLAPLIRLHLSDADGVPMHAVQNGWYWAGGSRWNGREPSQPPNAANLAGLLRIGGAEAARIVTDVLGGAMGAEAFADFVEAQKPRWKAEAVAAAAFLQTGAWPAAEPEAEAGPAPRR